MLVFITIFATSYISDYVLFVIQCVWWGRVNHHKELKKKEVVNSTVYFLLELISICDDSANYKLKLMLRIRCSLY